MKRLTAVIFGSCLVLGGCLNKPETYQFQKVAQQFGGSPLADGNGTDPVKPGSAGAGDNDKDGRADSEPEDTAQSLADDASLKVMLEILFKYSIDLPPQTLAGLLAELTELGHQPSVAKDSNEGIATMSVVRTFRPMFGTRYFHGQFEGDGGEGTYMQHMSFEFRPGPVAWLKVRKAIEARNPVLKEPFIDDENMVAWRLTNGYHIYMRQLQKEDLFDNPVNVYSNDDIGTISIAVEIDPHGGGEDDEHEGEEAEQN